MLPMDQISSKVLTQKKKKTSMCYSIFFNKVKCICFHKINQYLSLIVYQKNKQVTVDSNPFNLLSPISVYLLSIKIPNIYMDS